jgi:hypothetical protein
MKSFKIREGKILLDGVMYADTPLETNIKGKAGRIHSISIGGRQYFPHSGEFIDDTIGVSEDNTGLMEETKPVKKTRKTK